ncbi:MAG: TonB-dependent receptor [Desulfatitalea sp.]|nr:TonB-dependent receptor [Desulfatitalea sp.]
MKRRVWLAIATLSVLAGNLLSMGSLFADETAKGVYQLDAMVVSTTRTEIPVFDAPQSVTVIGAAEIAALPFERVEDIVRSLAGVYNFRHYGLQTNGIVSPLIMRGVGRNRVLLLVDGVPQNDNFNNAIAWVGWGHIPKETIERIEIVRGPTSALYGSEGLGGVIHIITKKPRAQRRTSVRLEGGSGETYAGHAFHSQKIGDFGFILGGGYEDSNGFYMTENPEAYEIKRYRELGRVLGKASYDIGDRSEISLAALYYDYGGGQGRRWFYNEMQIDQYWLNVSHTAEAVALKGLVYYNQADKSAFQDSITGNQSILNREEKLRGTYTWGADLQATLFNRSAAPLTIGVAYKDVTWHYNEDYATSDRDAGAEGRQRFISPFANLDMRFLDERLILNIGARYDWIETSDGANFDTVAAAGQPPYDVQYDTERLESFSPKLGIAYHPDNRTTLRASAGKGFRAPTLFELYKVHVRSAGRFYRFANPDLEPEEIWSYDVGVERSWLDSLWGRLTFYQSFAKDYISDRLLSTQTLPNGTTREFNQLENVEEVDIYGIELELRWEMMRALTLFGNYTFNVSKIAKNDNNPETKGNYLTNDPRHKVHVGARYANPRWLDVTLLTNYYADIYYDSANTLKTGDYWTVDVSLSRKFRNHVTLFLNAENIFDEKYPIFLSTTGSDTTSPGIIVSGGVKFDF